MGYNYQYQFTNYRTTFWWLYCTINAGSAQTTTLSVSDGSTGAVLAHRVIEFTGTITGNQIVTIPLDVQQLYVIKNGTSGAYTVQFKYVSGSGSSVTFAATDKGTKLLYAAADHASNPNIVDSGLGSTGAYDLDGNELTLDADSDTSITASTDDQIDFEISGADDFTMTANAFNVLTGSHVTFADSANAKFGTGNDMLMYHDGSNSYITNAVGALKIATETSGIAVTIGHTTSEDNNRRQSYSHRNFNRYFSDCCTRQCHKLRYSYNFNR
jgi:hypothetical protein